MTSPANAQNITAPIPAPTTSYASAAGASKKPAATPVIATGSTSAPAQHHAASSTPSPMNGKAQIPPAVPAVARGSSSVNGNMAAHDRKGSVSFPGTNGGPVGGGPKGAIPQFGFQDSPLPTNSTLQQTTASPMPVPSPAHSPSPIPQPSASGGRPPSTIQDGSSMKFGSLGGDGDVSLIYAKACPFLPLLDFLQAESSFRVSTTTVPFLRQLSLFH